MRLTFVLKTCLVKGCSIYSISPPIKILLSTLSVDKEPVVSTKSPLSHFQLVDTSWPQVIQRCLGAEAKRWIEAVRTFVPRLVGGKVSKLCLCFCSFIQIRLSGMFILPWPLSHILIQILPLAICIHFHDS